MGIFLISCADKAQTQEDCGFIEREVAIPEGIYTITDLCKMNNGTLRLVGVDESITKVSVWDSRDKGETWTKQKDYSGKLPFKTAKNTEIFGYIGNTQECGFVVNTYAGETLNEISQRFFIINSEGEVKELKIKLPMPADSDGYIWPDKVDEMYFLDDGSLYVKNMVTGLYKIDKETGEVQNTLFQDSSSFVVEENKVYMIHAKRNQEEQLESKIKIIDDKSGAQTEDDNLLEQLCSDEAEYRFENKKDPSELNTTLFAVSEKDGKAEKYYYLNDLGIWSYSKEGKTKLVDGRTTSIGNQKILREKLIPLDDGELVLWAGTESSSNLFVYAENAN